MKIKNNKKKKNKQNKNKKTKKKKEIRATRTYETFINNLCTPQNQKSRQHSIKTQNQLDIVHATHGSTAQTLDSNMSPSDMDTTRTTNQNKTQNPTTTGTKYT